MLNYTQHILSKKGGTLVMPEEFSILLDLFAEAYMELKHREIALETEKAKENRIHRCARRRHRKYRRRPKVKKDRDA